MPAIEVQRGHIDSNASPATALRDAIPALDLTTVKSTHPVKRAGLLLVYAVD